MLGFTREEIAAMIHSRKSIAADRCDELSREE